MIEDVKKYIKEHSLLSKGQKVLLTVSGGKDSVCMAYVFALLDIEFCIAHCNFKLRGAESDADHKFVQELAKKLKVPFFSEVFDTSTYASEHKISIQMAARDLRYDWFDELSVKHDMSVIATAHHQDDNIETLLIKKSRKSSLEGLRGILPKNGKVIRPFLGCSAEEIVVFIVDNGIQYREDSSNKSVDYDRNKLRLHTIPQMNKKDAEFRKNALKEISDNVLKYQQLQKQVNDIASTSLQRNENGFLLKLDKIQALKNKKDILYELFKAYGPFNWIDLFQLLSAINGKTIFNANHRIIKERDGLVLTNNKKNAWQEVFIQTETAEIHYPFTLSFTTLDKQFVDIKKDAALAFLDFHSLSFPLQLRKWKHGDFFRPFGMDGTKKISDFMIDQKFSMTEKENTWVLCSDEEVVWVVGYRISQDFKLVAETEKVYLVEPF